WLFDDYDFEGKHSPWYSKQERIQMGNISYMSILSNVMQNVVGSGKSRFFTTVNRGLAMMIGKFYSWKLKNKRYKYAPELALARAFRRKIFYENKSPFFETWMKFPKSFKHSQLLPKPGLR
ncbi:MAG: hypothetical protein HQ512_04860, partial [Rhodospirillales bacterium]|nr:hypothetical protein [Rhodospirillales bacterium]